MNILWFHCTYIKPSWKIAFYILTQSEILSLLYAQCNISREYKTVLWLPLMSIKAKLNYAINFRVKSCDKSDLPCFVLCSRFVSAAFAFMEGRLDPTPRGSLKTTTAILLHNFQQLRQLLRTAIVMHNIPLDSSKNVIILF